MLEILPSIARSKRALAASVSGLAIAVSVAANVQAQEASSAYDYFLRSTPDYAGAIASNPAIKDSASESAPLPVTIDKTGNGISMRAGISDWRNYKTKQLEERVNEARQRSGKDLKMPKAAPAADPALDLWTKVGTDNTTFDSNQTMSTSAGADYRLSKSTTAGVSVEQSEGAPLIGAAPIPTDRKMSAYMNLKASSMLSVDAKTQWQRAEGEALAGVAPSERESFSIAPKLEKKFDIGNGMALTPYATVKHRMEFDASNGDSSATNSAGAGLTLDKADDYSVSVSTDVEHSESSNTPSVNSKLQFKLPLQ